MTQIVKARFPSPFAVGSPKKDGVISLSVCDGKKKPQRKNREKNFFLLALSLYSAPFIEWMRKRPFSAMR